MKKEYQKPIAEKVDFETKEDIAAGEMGSTKLPPGWIG